MTDVTGTRRQFGEGPLSRAAAFVYTLLTVEALTVVACLPGLVPVALLGRDLSNLPIAALCAVPLGPALSAGLYTIQHRHSDLTDLEPAAAFLRGYRANACGVLALWIPALAWLTVVGVTLANFAAAGVPGWWAVMLAVIGVAVTLWCVNAVVIASLFAFRVRDVARLAAYFLARTPGATLATACVVFACAGIALLLSEVVLVLLLPLVLLVLLNATRPMTASIRAEFTA